ncbi:MAG TPA: sugar transferase [Pirellula sp.]|nr:sugar transferase [Pirellula sp.]
MLQLVRDPENSKQPSSDSEFEILSGQNVCVEIAPSQTELRTIALSNLIHHPMPRWKRWFDVIAASLLLVVLTPLLAMICVFIRCVSKGPVFFSQERLGEMGKYFVIYKFRTLHPENTLSVVSEHREFVAELANRDVAAAKPDLRSRLIPCGGFLRSTSLDELPQLLNVLKGEMSLIGPRPDVLDWHDYPAWQLKRFEVTPGITGLWQVSGKNRLTFCQMVELDIRYVERRSVLLDTWILIQTVKLVLNKDNK